MDAAEIVKLLHAAGINLTLTGDRLTAAPSSRMTDELRGLIRGHKAELMDLLQAAHSTTAELLKAAQLACDYHHDSEAARQQMRDECLALPPRLQADLLEHFRQTYPDKDPS